MHRSHDSFVNAISCSEHVESCRLALPDFVSKVGGAVLLIKGDQFSKIMPWNAPCERSISFKGQCARRYT